MQVLVYEFFSAGGCDRDQETSASLMTEGAAMVAAVTGDLARIDSLQPVVIQDQRLDRQASPPLPDHCRVVTVDSQQREQQVFEHLVAQADWTLLIAPEWDGILLRRIRIGKNHPLLPEFFLQGPVDHFTLKLRLDTRQVLSLGLGYPQFFKGFLDLLRHIIPSTSLFVGRLEIIINIIKIQRDLAAPIRHRFGLKDFERLQAKLAHPVGLTFDVRNLLDHLRIESFFRLKNGFGLGAEIVFLDIPDFFPGCFWCDFSCDCSFSVKTLSPVSFSNVSD